MQDLLLNIQDLNICVGSFEIKKINLELERGDIVGVVGRSGSGKSTFIKSLIGQVKINKGRISIKGKSDHDDILDYVGYSPQENSVYSYLTLEENIVIFGQLHNISKDIIHTRMDELLKRLDLLNEKDKKIINMSGGMKKRADLAISLIHDPELILLDEPFNGLDISLQKFIWFFLKELSAQGKIILISSHLLTDLRKNCNKFCLIDQGIFYNPDQVKTFLKTNQNVSLEIFLEKVFDKTSRK